MALALAAALDKGMQIAPLDPAQPTAILVAGPHGAGKTTVAAKIAAHARLARREVRFVATDPEGAGALARLETFAGHLGADVLVAEDADTLGLAVMAAQEAGAVLIADSRGFDPRAHHDWHTFLQLAESDIEVVGVISALNDAEEAGEIAHALGELGARRLVVTGLDAARRRGALVSVALAGPAIAQVSRSPYLAEGLEPLTPLGLARDIVARSRTDSGVAR